MRKKHDKIVLKSDVFKAKTPEKVAASASRSPISRSPYLSKKEEEKIDPNDLFQKVCCPNCRFIFKIIKNSDNILTVQSRRKDKQVSQLTQTQQAMLRETIQIKTLSADLMKRLTPESEALSKTNYLKNQMYQINELPYESGREESFRLNDLSAIPISSKLQPNKSSLRSSVKVGDKLSEQSSFLQQPNKERQESKNKDDLKELLYQLYMGNKTTSMLIELFSELPTTLQVPAYHKMLLQSESKSQIKT